MSHEQKSKFVVNKYNLNDLNSPCSVSIIKAFKSPRRAKSYVKKSKVTRNKGNASTLMTETNCDLIEHQNVPYAKV